MNFNLEFKYFNLKKNNQLRFTNKKDLITR